ncbi:MAG TPA: cation transporter [Candidatus Nanoarchaeia archaeon]|nr:cation transporter [Candidatus Nanoarchaeia archaeon]
MGTAAISREIAVRRGRRLEYLTVLWNSLEALISIVAGILAGSIALVGFGLDSVIETSSGAVMLWRLHHSNERDVAARQRAERIALRLVGVSFLALATYVGIDAAISLYHRDAPEGSIVGIGIAALSLIVMPLLARAKRRVASQLNSGAMQADSRQTDICAYLSAILLGGLALNAALGWWWADPIAALVMVPIIAKEGVEALHNKSCTCH